MGEEKIDGWRSELCDRSLRDVTQVVTTAGSHLFPVRFAYTISSIRNKRGLSQEDTDDRWEQDLRIHLAQGTYDVHSSWKIRIGKKVQQVRNGSSVLRIANGTDHFKSRCYMSLICVFYRMEQNRHGFLGHGGQLTDTLHCHRPQ